ncbi:hypothetical protein HDU89_005905, partial [Geranomyces variabilis]
MAITLLELPVDITIYIAARFLNHDALHVLSCTHSRLRSVLAANSTTIYLGLQQNHIAPSLLACHASANGAIPFAQSDIDLESRLRAGGTTGDQRDKKDAGALYFFLLSRQRKVVERAAAVVARLAADPRAASDLIANGKRVFRAGRSAQGEEGPAGDGDLALANYESCPRPSLETEALRAVLLLQWTVDILRLFGCSATKASKSSPGYSLIGCKYVRWILADLCSEELRVVFWAILNLSGYSFTAPSTKWRSDAQGFEVARFEM